MERENLLKKFGLRLKEFRTQKNISQEVLADICQLDRTYISGLERGVRNPSLICVFKVAQGLGVSADKLVKELD
ncbi:helix-turn-helix transcriptional regulator [bacterium]|jgi:transcriptional regulator with XRE-family HTH domain|nr:helix-turn-helix transcriptional regulator [Candidatus Neomarinimicrobiota bacterium]MBT6121507.1 helix-turn-helix transcriptional regulator [bacterium]